MSQSSKSKLDVYTGAVMHLISADSEAKSEGSKSKKASRKSQEETEEPVYLDRV